MVFAYKVKLTLGLEYMKYWCRIENTYHMTTCTHFAALNIKNMFIKYMITCYFGMRDAMYNHTDRTSLAIGWHRST